MRTPIEVAEVAEICSKVVRSTNHVRRGAGAAREDVNVSVTGGTRIEIKGVPKISRIPLLTYNEAMRQWNLLRLREELRKRGITPKTFRAEYFDITKIIKSTYYLPLKEAKKRNVNVKCVLLKGFRDLLNWQTQTDTYFSREISDRVRVIACLTTIPNIIHSDGKGDTLTSAEWQQIKKFVNAESDDAVVVVWGDKEDTETAVKEIIIRAKEASIGIPSETRQALRDGTNGFERILPGADRMYPDTDLPPKRIPSERMNKLRINLPKPYWERIKWYTKLKIPKDIIEPLAISKYANLFEACVKLWKLDATLISVVLIQYPKRLKKKYNTDLLTISLMRETLSAYKDGLISKDGILTALENSLKMGGFYPEMMPAPCLESELEEVVNEAKSKIHKLILHDENNKQKLIVGLVMDSLRLRMNGSAVSKYVKNSMKGRAK
jgi:glutamyl-tRNA(Gln) amidotransferase subunit E